MAANIRLGDSRLLVGPLGPNVQVTGPLLDYADGVFARASVATYWDLLDINGAGPFRYDYAANVPRILADGSYLCEEARTNACLQSNAVDQAPWASAGGVVTVTPDAAAGPDGALTADRLQIASAARRYQAAGALALGDWSFSSFLKPFAADLDWQLSFANLVAAGAIGGLAPGWQRKELPWVNTGGAVDWNFDGRNQVGIGGVAAHTEDVLSGGAQLEASKWVGEYVDTAGASGTKQPDTMTLPLAKIPEEMRTGKYQFDIWAKMASVGLPGRQYLFAIPDPAIGVGGLLSIGFRAFPNRAAFLWYVNHPGAPVVAVPAFSGLFTFTSVGQKITATVDFVAGEITVAGATTGNGVHAFPWVNAWWPNNNSMDICHRGNLLQFNGRISQPVAA